jgi:hypothetical protein
MGQYNDLPPCSALPTTICRAEVVDLQSNLWLYLTKDGNAPGSDIERRMIDNFLMKERANEELEYIKADVARMKYFYLNQLSLMKKESEKFKTHGNLGAEALFHGQMKCVRKTIEILGCVGSASGVILDDCEQFSDDLFKELAVVEAVCEENEVEK